MKASQFEAKTYGLGELITQKKLFRVPAHQRSFAWDQEAVAQFLEDSESAFDSYASEYFVGLVVIQGPEGGEWVLLDGQQRLTTASLVFAAIRNWLSMQSFDEDSKQIETEYLAVRRLGGDYSPRMILNEENKDVFSTTVMEVNAVKDLRLRAKNAGKRSSNRSLLEAAAVCQAWIDRLAAAVQGDNSDKARRLFELAYFLESKVKVVCVEVSTDVDAYVLFESLNDRGVELSALDLIKNYIFSRTPSNTAVEFSRQWSNLIGKIEDRNPDDFLKVFWTSYYGVVQKAQIFRRLREKYPGEADAEKLLLDLNSNAALLKAIEDREDKFWNDYDPLVRDGVAILQILGAKQCRSVLMAALRHLDAPFNRLLVWSLTVALIRFQIIGQGRTGVVEKVLGRLSQLIATESMNEDALLQELAELDTGNEEFCTSFIEHEDFKDARISYFLSSIYVHESQKVSGASSFTLTLDLMSKTTVVPIVGGASDGSKIWNHVLFTENYELLYSSALQERILTNSDGSAPHTLESIKEIGEEVAGKAERFWRFSREVRSA